ncbi:hypothetical protein [Bacillus atrophaeus]
MTSAATAPGWTRPLAPEPGGTGPAATPVHLRSHAEEHCAGGGKAAVLPR